MAVRLALLLTGKPAQQARPRRWRRRARAAPGWRRSARRARANARAVSTSSLKPTTQHAERGQQQLPQVMPGRRSGSAGTGRPAGIGPTTATPCAGQAERRRRSGGQQHGQQRPGCPRPAPLRRGTGRRARTPANAAVAGLDAADPLGERGRPRRGTLRPPTGTPVTRAKLARDHDQRDAGQVADERPAGTAGRRRSRAAASPATAHSSPTSSASDVGQRRVARRVPGRQRPDRDRRHQRGRRLRPHRQRPRRAEHRVDHQRRAAPPTGPATGGSPATPRVRHDLRDQVGGHGDARRAGRRAARIAGGGARSPRRQPGGART